MTDINYIKQTMIFDDLHNKCSDANAKTLVAYSDLKNLIHSFDQTLIILIVCYNKLALTLLHLMNGLYLGTECVNSVYSNAFVPRVC